MIFLLSLFSLIPDCHALCTSHLSKIFVIRLFFFGKWLFTHVLVVLRGQNPLASELASAFLTLTGIIKKILNMILPEKYPRIKTGDELHVSGMNYNWGSKISAVKAPSLLSADISIRSLYYIINTDQPQTMTITFCTFKRFPCFFNFFSWL